MKEYRLINVEEASRAPQRWWNVLLAAKYTEIGEYPSRTSINALGYDTADLRLTVGVESPH
jgi:hypothetical protein